MNKLFFTATLALILFWACRPETKPSEAAQLQPLLEEMRTWKCLLLSWHASSVALWDSVGLVLERELPATMPADEKRNMLAVRNTGLIQMFDIYPQLDTGIQSMVETAGVRDSSYAVAMRRAHDSLVAREVLLHDLLIELERSDPESYQTWSARFQDLTCD